MLPLAGELAVAGYRRYIRPRLKAAWDYKATAAPLILSQKINKMPVVNVRGRNVYKSTSRSRSKSYSPMQTSSKSRDRLGALVTPVSKRPRTKTVKTPGGRKVRVRNVGALNSKSAGRLRTKKFRMSKKMKIASKGISHTHEVGREETTGTQSIWVGHNSAPVGVVLADFWRLLLKKLAYKSGFNIRNFSSVPEFITLNDVIDVYYQAADGALSSVAHVFAVGNTWEQIANTFIFNASLIAPGTQLKFMRFNPTVNAVGTSQDRSPVRLDLEFATISFYAKSTMKIQNRTQNSSIDSEAVDNVPLYGKIYGGTGNGIAQMTNITSGTTAMLVADAANGYILGNSADLGCEEPPHQWFFPGCKKAGKIHLDPGEVKTSTLIYKKRCSVNQFKKLLQDDNTANKVRTSFGKYAVFGIEKMIQSVAPSLSNIKIGVEINHFMAMNLSVKHRDVTAQLFSTNYA